MLQTFSKGITNNADVSNTEFLRAGVEEVFVMNDKFLTEWEVVKPPLEITKDEITVNVFSMEIGKPYRFKFCEKELIAIRASDDDHVEFYTLVRKIK